MVPTAPASTTVMGDLASPMAGITVITTAGITMATAGPAITTATTVAGNNLAMAKRLSVKHHEQRNPSRRAPGGAADNGETEKKPPFAVAHAPALGWGSSGQLRGLPLHRTEVYRGAARVGRHLASHGR